MRSVKIKMRNLIALFFSLILTLAVFSQITPSATLGVAQGAVSIINSSDWLYYKSNNDLSAYLGKKNSSLPTVRYQKGNDYLEFSLNQTTIGGQKTEISSSTSVSLETNVKKSNTPTLFYRNILNDIDANYQITNVPFRVKEEIVLKTNPKHEIRNPKQIQNSNDKNSKQENLTFIFSAETSAKPIKQQDGSIAFFDKEGNYLFQLDKPFMVDAKGTRSEKVGIEIIPIQTKTADKSAVFGDSNLSRKSGLLPINKQYIGIKNIVNRLVDIKNVLDLGGIEPPESRVAIRAPHQARPRTKLFYHKEKETEIIKQYQITLRADANWLNSPDRVYPVIIDPTITHNADANFTGQMNRIADNDSTSSTQLESSYGEAVKDPYTVLLLHFNEANGSTNIKDYASTTRVITANGNASTTNYVTQLGTGNSGAFDGTGDYFSLPDNDDWNFGSGDFSIDFWVRFNSTPGQILFLDQINGTDYQYLLWNTTILEFGSFLADVGKARYYFTWSPPLNKWQHIAVVRNGNSFDMFLNGISQSPTAAIAIGNNTLVNVASPLTIGDRSSGSFGLNGYLDSLRILKGRALTPEEIKAAAARRPYAVYTSSVLDATVSVPWNTLNWTEGGVNTGLSSGAGNGEQPYSANSLVAQWDFNDTSGTTLTASSSGSCTTSCNGTLTNFAYTASQDQATTTTGWTANNKRWGAGALMMESAAAADYVSVSDPASNVLDPNSADLTIETWIKTNDTSAEIFSNNNANGTACTNNGYYLGIDANGYPVFYLDTNGATAGCDASTTSQFKINDGNWHEVSVAVTRGTSAVIYVDGKSAGSDTSVTSYSAITVTGTVYFGGSAGGLDAIIDSSRFYSRALSAAEILSNYNAGNIEIQTRTGATSDPNDGTWEAWKPTTGETQLLSMDSDAANWRSDIMASTTIATSTDTVIKAEGTGSLKVKMGMASTTAGTVALWHFEETGTTTGTYLYDSTSNHNDATTTGTTVVDGIFGKARKFNGTSDYVQAPDSTNWDFGTGDFSIDMWVKFNSNSDTQYLLGKFNSGSGGWAVSLGGSGTVFRLYDSWNTSVDVSWTPTINVWYYVVVERSGSSIKFFVNGIQQGASQTAASAYNGDNNPLYIGQYINNGSPLKGLLDELRILKGRALSADEIAETYRMGANHHLTRQVSATDMSSANKLAFNVAADSPGTYLEAMLGESDYANYELASSTLALSTNTVLYIKGDEIASSTSLKDSSFSGKAITANGNARTSGNGKIGNSVYFDGNGDYFSLPDNDDWNFGTGDFSIDFWLRFNALTNYQIFFGQQTDANNRVHFRYTNDISTPRLQFQHMTGGSVDIIHETNWTPSAGAWYHIALVKSSNTYTTYVNGASIGSTTDSSSNADFTGNFYIGSHEIAFNQVLNGWLDELRIIKGTALSADQIRQAYEYGLRSHQITIDFGATLQPSDLISNSTDYNFSITATTSGLSATTSGLYLGDKIIIKENLGGTEYTAQGTVNAINSTTGAITVPSWDTGSTFPSGNGYSPNATVFKWQREYFDLGGAATTTRNAITNITLRPTNNGGGRTIWLDDFRYNTNYLTASSSSSITSSNGRYLQYRTIFSSWDSFVSPYLSAINTLYTSLATMFPPAIGVSGGGFLSF